jgi:hypothetical protein
MVAYLDRINIGYAQLQMKETLSFGDAVYGQSLLERIGARKTLRIMMLWGVTAAR